MDSYWPHHALTYQVAGCSRTATAPMPAHTGFSRRIQATQAASPKSASTAGSLRSIRSHVSDASVAVRKPGSSAPSEPPDVGHHGPEREVLVVGVRESVRGDVAGPLREDIQIPLQACRRQQDGTDDDRRRSRRSSARSPGALTGKPTSTGKRDERRRRSCVGVDRGGGVTGGLDASIARERRW